VQQEIIAPQKEECSKNTNGEKFVLLGILLIVAVVFSGSLKLQWTNWDDHLLVYENPLVQHPHLKDIFIKPADYNTYNPLVLITFALEWMLVGDRPFLYHFHNVLLHLLCTTLVWLVFRRLGLSAWWSGLAALFFGIHPLRVESVAWISERKDVLFGFFIWRPFSLISVTSILGKYLSVGNGNVVFACAFIQRSGRGVAFYPDCTGLVF